MNRFLATLSLFALLVPQVSFAVYNPTGGGTYRLQTSAGSADTTIRLSSFREPVSNNAYTMTYLNTDIVCGTLDPQTSRSEFISFTGITQNSDGSAILTGVTRGLGRSYPYTASSTLRQAHPAQSVFIISDAPCLFNQYGIKQNDENVTGYWDVPTPLSDDNIANKSYVDNLVNGGTVSNAAVVVPGTAGETLAAGDIVYLRISDGRWYLTDNDSPGFLINGLLGISQGGGTAGNAVTGGVLLHGLDTNQSGLVAGTNYFVSGTAGDLTTATTTRSVGKARGASSLYVDFYYTNPFLAANNTWTGSTTFATSSITIGAFPAYNIGKNIQVFSSTGTTTFSVPSGITKVKVRVQAGGGRGGNGTNASPDTGGGGAGGGGYAEEYVNVSGTSTIQVYVGPGGVSGDATGKRSTFGTIGSEFLSAAGGVEGVGAAAGAGGCGTGGDINTCGGSGEEGMVTNSTNHGGVGGSSHMGGGGRGATDDNEGTAGANYGGGGGAGNGNGGGGDGAQGIVIVEW